MNILRMVARPLLAAPFIADGISAVRDPDPHVGRVQVLTPLLERAGIEPDEDQLRLATRIVGGVTTLAGLSLALGRGTRTSSAAVLATLAVPLAVVNNPVWTASSRDERRLLRRGLTRSLALFGGLLRAQRQELKQVRAQAWEDAQRVYQE